MNDSALPRILFLCTGNSCRSQMAEGWLRHLAGDRFVPLSAGLEPAEGIHPLAIQVMAEEGIDLAGQRPKGIEVYLGREWIRWLIVVCDRANQSCPRVWPMLAERNRLYWPLDDPAAAPGTEAERLAVFRRVRDELRQRLAAWLAEQP